MTTRFHPAARADISTYFKYLLEKASPTIALRFRAQVEHSANALAQHPEIGSLVFPGGPGLLGVRSWPVPTFLAMRLYYTHESGSVQILRVLHGKRDIQRILQSRSKLL